MKEEEVALARSQIYKLLSLALDYPGEPLKASISDGLFISQLTESAEKLPSYDLIKKYIQLLKTSIKKYGENISSAILAEYIDLFGQNYKPKCSPYELEYLSRGPLFMNTAVLADIAGFYKAFGLQVANDSKERVDHISIELEFMYFLTFKEAFILKRTICLFGFAILNPLNIQIL